VIPNQGAAKHKGFVRKCQVCHQNYIFTVFFAKTYFIYSRHKIIKTSCNGVTSFMDTTLIYKILKEEKILVYSFMDKTYTLYCHLIIWSPSPHQPISIYPSIYLSQNISVHVFRFIDCVFFVIIFNGKMIFFVYFSHFGETYIKSIASLQLIKLFGINHKKSYQKLASTLQSQIVFLLFSFSVPQIRIVFNFH